MGAFKSLTGKAFPGDSMDHAYGFNTTLTTKNEIDKMPTILFQMTPWKSNANYSGGLNTAYKTKGNQLDLTRPESILVKMSPEHYMEYDQGSYKFRFRFNKGVGQPQVLGANFMAGKDVLHDLENSRVGFAESNCDFFALQDIVFYYYLFNNFFI